MKTKMKKTLLYLSLILTQAFNLSAESYTLTNDDVVVEKGVIQSCSYDFAIKDIVIPDSLDGQEVLGIADGKMMISVQSVFGNYGIEKITLPASIKTIGSFAFYGNSINTLNLTNCTALTAIEPHAFEGNEIASFALPTPSLDNFAGWADWDENIHSGGAEATNTETYYRALLSYTLTNDDVVIDEGEIVSCSYDFSANDITIPDVLDSQTITSIGDGAFEDKGILRVSLPSALQNIGTSAFKSNRIRSIDFSTCASAISSIEMWAFYDNLINSVDLTECTALKSFSAVAFGDQYQIDYVVLPESSSDIGQYWADSDKHTLYSLGDTVRDTWNGCHFLKEYTLTDDDVEVSDGTITKCLYDLEGNGILLLNIPDRLQEQEITGIKSGSIFIDKVFKARLEYVNLPSSIQYIGDKSFLWNYIFYVNFTDCPALQYIGDEAFSYNELNIVDLSQNKQLTYIGASAFNSQYIDEQFTLPDCSVKGFVEWQDEDGNVFEPGAVITDTKAYTAVIKESVYDVAFQLTDQKGNPLPSATVNFNGTDYTTDSNGDIIVPGLEAGDYNYTVSLEGYESASGSVSVVDEDIIKGVTMSSFLHKVSITVTDVYGDPVANASVEFDGIEYMTNSAGKVTITGLKAGVYNFSAQAEVYKLYEESVVLAGEDVDLSIKLLYKKYTASLTVIDKNGAPVVNAKIIIKNVYGSTSISYQTDIKGTVVGNDLRVKTYAFSIEADGYEYYEGEFVIADENISLTVDDLVPVTYSAALSLVDTEGDPVADAVVNIEGGEFATDDNGKLTIDGLANGNHSFSVEADGYSPAVGSFTINGQDVEVQAIEMTKIETPVFSISFTVVDKANNPVTGAAVTIGTDSYTADADGKLDVKVEAGDYTYKVEASGFISSSASISVADAAVSETVVLSSDNTAIQTNSNTEFAIFPSPARDVVVLELDESIKVRSAKIINTAGTVIVKEIEQGKIKVEDLTQGLYYILLNPDEGATLKGSFVKE